MFRLRRRAAGRGALCTWGSHIEKLFKGCDPEEQLWYKFFLMTGMREQEVMDASWADVNLTRNTGTVRHKLEYGFSPKNYREREIPIPLKLVQSLKAWKAKSDGTCGLVFPTAGCQPKLDFLDCLKGAAKRAKLKPEDFWLHQFRATLATSSLGRRRSAHRPAVARPFGYGIHDALSEAIAEPTGAREG